MKKIAVIMRKYINRISVLVTVFAVLMTASFYNPASLAATSNSFIWRVVSPDPSGSWILWNPSEHDLGSYISGASAYALLSAGAPQNTNTGVEHGIYTYHVSLPFWLWPLSEREPSDTFVADGKFNLQLLLRTSSAFSPTPYCGPVSVNGVLPDGVSVSYFYTSGNFTLSNSSNSQLGVQFVFDNVQLGANKDHISFTIDFDMSVTFPSGNYDMATTIYYSFTVQDENMTFTSGFADGSGRDITDGYDASSGNASQSKLDTSLSQSEAKQDSLFTSASDTLSDFALSDISTMPKVVSALSFVSSTMTSIYTALGGINGVGIVLSVGCSILFVSLAVGAYKFYSSHKD